MKDDDYKFDDDNMDDSSEGGSLGYYVIAFLGLFLLLCWVMSGQNNGQSVVNPLEFLNSISWESGNYNDIINTNTNNNYSNNSRYVTDEEYTYLTMLVCCEAGWEPFDGKVAVAACALNRLDAGMGGNTLTEVIYSPGVFSCIWDDGWFHLGQTPYDYYGLLYDSPVDVQDAERAVDAALAGQDPTRGPLGGGALYYYNPDGCDDYELSIRSTISKTYRIGNHIFYRVWD